MEKATPASEPLASLAATCSTTHALESMFTSVESGGCWPMPMRSTLSVTYRRLVIQFT